MEKTAIVDSVESLLARIEQVQAAQKEFATFSQEQVDKIFLAAASAANKMRIPLAKMAVEETGMGVVEDKVIKNHYAAEYIYNAYENPQRHNHKSAPPRKELHYCGGKSCARRGCCGGRSRRDYFVDRRSLARYDEHAHEERRHYSCNGRTGHG